MVATYGDRQRPALDAAEQSSEQLMPTVSKERRIELLVKLLPQIPGNHILVTIAGRE